MWRASNSQSGDVLPPGLPVSLRTQHFTFVRRSSLSIIQLTPDYMANNSGQNNPSPESETNAQKEKLKKSGILPTPVVLVWLLGLVGAGLVTYGSGLLNAQFFWPGWTIICFGAVCGCVAARIWIINHKTKHRMPAWLDSNKTFGVAIFICAVVCGVAAFFSSRSSQNPKSAETSGPQKMLPNLTLALALSGSVSEPAKRVLLTNDFIVFNKVPEGGRIDVTNAVGAIESRAEFCGH